MEKVCEEINYAAVSFFTVASLAFTAVAAETHAALFLAVALVSLFQSVVHFIAMMASRERQRASDAPDNVRG